MNGSRCLKARGSECAVLNTATVCRRGRCRIDQGFEIAESVTVLHRGRRRMTSLID